MEELEIIEKYLLHNEYPPGYNKTDKANLRRKCRNNFKLEDSVVYFRKKVSDENEP